ncbi:hypothetical protein HZS_1421, partial [Henneguya salminicola]
MKVEAENGFPVSNLATKDRLLDFNSQALLAAVDEKESWKIRMLDEDFNVGHSTIARNPKKLGKFLDRSLTIDPTTIKLK